MSHCIQHATMITPEIIQAVFIGGEVIQYNLRQVISTFPQFQEIMKNPQLASQLSTDVGGYGISWNDELDLDAETIWENGVLIRIESVSTERAVAASLARAREYAKLTQRQLAEKTGIHQGDISKLERGIGNPSLSTLKRLADGMDMELHISFIPSNSADN